MFRILIFLFIFWIFFYNFFGIFQFSKTISQEESSQKYNSLLSDALKRNSSQHKLYSVIFYRDNFIDTEHLSPWKKKGSIIDLSENQKYQTWEYSLLGQNIETKDKIASMKWSFWTPIIPESTQWLRQNTSCAGLIFDPCVVIWDPIMANGWMYFWSTRTYN